MNQNFPEPDQDQVIRNLASQVADKVAYIAQLESLVMKTREELAKARAEIEELKNPSEETVDA